MSYQSYGTRDAHNRRAQVAQALMASSVNRTPQNVGEGIGAVGRALFGMLASRANARQEREGQAAAQQNSIDPIVALLTARGDPRAAAFGATPASALPAPAPASPIDVTPIPPASVPFDVNNIARVIDEPSPDPVSASAAAAGIDPEAWAQQIRVESGGNPNAVSPAGATGVAQIMPETARNPGFGVPTIFDVARQLGRPVPDTSDATLQALLRDEQVNATFGALYQRAMLDQHGGDPTLAAAAYNAGPGAVQRAGGVPNFPETQNYVRSVQPRLAGDPLAGATMSGQAMAPTQASAQAVQPIPAQGDSRAALIPLLMRAAGNDWLPESQRAVVQAMLQQELGAGQNGSFGLTPIYGTDAQGNPILLQLNSQGGAAPVNLPQGVNISRDPIRIDAGTSTVLLDPVTRQPIGSVPRNNRAAAAETAAGTTAGRAEAEAVADAPRVVSQADIILSDVDAIINDPGLENAVGWGAYVPFDIPGFNAETRSRLNKLEGQAFLQAFESLKGSGQITELEGAKATQAIARLNRAQSPEEFRGALREFREVIAAARERAARRLPTRDDATSAPAQGGVLRYNPATGELQ